jgi:hypothetical protein
VNNRLALTFIKSFNADKSYEGLSFEVKKLYNINNTSRINKCKAIRFKVDKGN